MKKLFLLILLLYTAFNSFSQGQTFTVTNLNDSGPGSLREAITFANAISSTPDSKNQILFDASLSSPYTIVLGSSLPIISNPTVVDGKITSSQDIIIDGNNIPSIIGLRTSGSDCEFKNINLENFGGNTSTFAILIQSDNNLINYCNINNCYRSIHIQNSNNKVIRCRITNPVEGGHCIYLMSSNNTEISDGNHILNITSAGSSTGIYVHSSAVDTYIGGEITSPEQMNVIGGFGNGIISYTTNPLYLFGNLIGGPSKLSNDNCSGNDLGKPNTTGVYLAGQNAEVGKVGQTHDRFANIILGNTSNSIFVNGDYNKIQGNYIGIDRYTCAPSIPVANNNGIYITFNSDNNIVGGALASTYNEFDGNVICNNKKPDNYVYGIIVRGGDGNSVNGNFIGTDRNNTLGIGNHWGVADYATNTIIDGNVISGNSEGVRNFNTTIVQNNKIGTDKHGLTAIPNNNGILVYSPNVLIKNNLISGNTVHGLRILDNNCTVIGNLIGPNINGEQMGNIADQRYGISNYLTPTSQLTGTVIGGASAAERNIISGNEVGINIYGTIDITIVGNYIGTNLAGTAAISNSNYGIYAPNYSNSGIKIGGNRDLGEGNLISGNTHMGIYLRGTLNSYIKGNLIGTNSSGNGVLANTGDGIRLYQCQNIVVGGSRQNNEGNILSGNLTNGLFLNESSNCVIKGNYIGSNEIGDILGNNYGIYFNKSTNNIVGAPIESETNTIANNNMHGIHMPENFSFGNKISGNLFINNGLKAINLNYNSTAGNNGKLKPVINSISYGLDGQIVISGISEPLDVVELFSGDMSGKNAYQLIGVANSDGSGNWNIMVSNLSESYFVSTATGNISNNTSELSDSKYFPRLIIDTEEVHEKTFTVTGAGIISSSLQSSTGGVNGKYIFYPTLPLEEQTSNVTIDISGDMDSETIKVKFDIDAGCNISKVRADLNNSGKFVPLSGDYYSVDNNHQNQIKVLKFKNREEFSTGDPFSINIEGNFYDKTQTLTFEITPVPDMDISSLSIYDISGNLVKTLSGTAVWDGTNTGGLSVESGVYTFELILTDTQSMSHSYKGQIIVKE